MSLAQSLRATVIKETQNQSDVRFEASIAGGVPGGKPTCNELKLLPVCSQFGTEYGQNFGRPPTDVRMLHVSSATTYAFSNVAAHRHNNLVMWLLCEPGCCTRPVLHPWHDQHK